MLWSQIINGHRTASVSPKIVQFYGAQPAAGRIVRFFINFLDIVRCPVKFRYYLKFQGALTAFGRVNERKIFGRRLHISDGHRTCGARLGIVRCLTSGRNFQKSLHKSADARPGTGRCPSGHRPMFYVLNCHRWEATCSCRRPYCIYIDISFL